MSHRPMRRTAATRPRSHPGVLLLPALLLALLAGCSLLEPSDHASLVDLPGSFSASGKHPAPPRWWTAFGDDTLDGLVAQALSGNLGLRVSWDRLRQAQAAARREGAASYPSLDVSESFTGSKSGASGRDIPSTESHAGTFAAALTASYELDLWGRVRSAQNAAACDALGSREDLRAAAMTLSAEIAIAWFRLNELRGQRALLDEQIETNGDYVDAASMRFRQGQVSATDVLQQRQALEALRGERVRLEASIRVEENRLAVLLGRAPGDFRAPDGALPAALPPLPATGTPAALVRKRPDLRASLLRLRAADRRVASAVADRFPRFSLSARAGVSVEVCDLVLNWLGNLAANLLAPLVDGGRRAAEVDRTRALASERLHAYGQVLLQALEEVENALAREVRQAAYLRSLDRQLDLSNQAVDRASEGYKKGTVDFTRFLTTTLSHQRLERTHLSARRDLVLYRIALYRSLGGSFDLTPPAKSP